MKDDVSDRCGSIEHVIFHGTMRDVYQRGTGKRSFLRSIFDATESVLLSRTDHDVR
jgi:hypothetical protein